MKRIILFIFSLFLLLGANQAKAQIDTVFWFSAPWTTPDHTGIAPVAFHFSTFGTATTIRMQQPASSYDTTFTVAANSLYSKYVDFMLNLVESKPADQVLNTGFKITASSPITIVYDIITAAPTFYNPETYSLKGQNGIGKEFVLPFQTLWHNRLQTGDLNGDGFTTQPYQQFSVVATEDNTTIYITPKCAIVGHPAGVTYSVVLPLKGNVYTGQNVTQAIDIPGNNMSGTIVVADKPVSVTVSEDSVQPTGGCADELGDQIVPTDVIGNEYIVNKGFLNAAVTESFFVVATENFTTVTINDGGVTTVILNQGDSYPYNITNPLTHIQSDKPVYVYHMSGYGCELGAAILPPLNCSGSDQVSFPRSNDQSFLLNILCKAGTEGAFILNGSSTLVPASAFNPVPGTGGAWMGAQISYNITDIPVNSANLLTKSMDNFSLGIINGGSSTGCLYHYISSFLRRVYTDAGNDTTLCNGESTISLNGTVKGGTITGLWEILDGTGTLNTPTSLSTTYTPSPNDYTQGSLTFVLTSTGNCTPVTDTMRVSFIQSPAVNAGTDNSYCKNNLGPIPITGTLNYAVGSFWSGGNGGSFGNSGNLNTTYTPSPADIGVDSVALFLTSQGSLYSCPDDKDTLVIYFTDPPVVVAGPDQVLCSSNLSAAINGTVTGASSTGTWTTSGSGAFNLSENDLSTNYLITTSDTAVGQVVLTLSSTLNGNCAAVQDSLIITILDKPLIEIATVDSICSNISAINLIGNVSTGFNSTWVVDGDGSIIDPSSLNTFYTISLLDLDTNYIDIYLQTDATICPIEKDSLRIQFINPPIVNAGVDQAFCLNQPIPLNGTISGPNSGGTWVTTGTGTFNPSNNLLNTFYIPSASDISSGNIKLILFSLGDFGCAPDKDTLNVTFKPAPTVDFSFTTACAGNNTSFQDLSTTTDGSVSNWMWQFGDSDSSIAQNPIHNYPGSGTYNATLIAGGSNGCYDTLQKVITVNPRPVANFDFGTPCEDVSLQIIDKSFISSGSVVSWSYDLSGGNTSTDQNPMTTFSDPIGYPVTLTVTSDLGCTDDTTKIITVNPSPNADFTMNPNPALALENVNYTDQSTGNTISGWFWSFGDGEGDNAQNTVHNYSDGGVYNVSLVVTDINGCTDSTSTNISIGLLPALPSGFTPNGDGQNDVFIIRGGPFNSVQFNVYNSWGQLIFQTNDETQGWDGTFNGKPSPLGVYSWTFVVEIYGGRVIKQSGDVTLMR